jgi:hypothetical protein
MWQGGQGMPMQGMPFPGMQMQGVPYGMPPQYMMQSMGMHPHAFPPFATVGSRSRSPSSDTNLPTDSLLPFGAIPDTCAGTGRDGHDRACAADGGWEAQAQEEEAGKGMPSPPNNFPSRTHRVEHRLDSFCLREQDPRRLPTWIG